jgi:juvenile hormone epoxide hydrolase
MSPTEMGNIFKRLMKRLGHDKFYVMGGDWGGIITTAMATVYPENVIAAQSNLCISMTVRGSLSYVAATLLPSLFMSEEEKSFVLPFPKMLSYMARETGYAHIQATKPDTVGVGLTHSPLGLAAYILEKFSTWTDRSWINREDGGLTENFTLDELLDNVMVYWVTRSMVSSQRLYAEEMDPQKRHQLDRVPTNVPFSCQFMRSEIVVLPEIALKDKYTNIQKYEISPRGGHFGAFEAPELVAENAISHFESN